MTILRACVVCGALSDRSRCRDHRPKDTRPSAAARGYDERWRQFRARFLRSHPSCARCFAKATDVHHIDGQGPLGPRGFDEGNCEALCGTCHRQHTAREQPGGWNDRNERTDR